MSLHNARLLFGPLLALGLLASPRAEALDVIGNLNVNTRWRLEDSPVRLTGDVTVAPQATLTIEPGVTIEAAASDGIGSGQDAARVELVVRGALLADGTLEAPIVFRGASSGAGAWYGIALEPGAQASSLTHVRVSDAEIGLWSRAGGTVTLSDAAFQEVGTGVRWQSSQGLLIERARFESATAAAVHVEDDGAQGVTATILASTFLTNQTGVRATDRVSLSVQRSTFAYGDVGVVVDAGADATVENSLFLKHLTDGLRLEQAGAHVMRVVNNTLDANLEDGVDVVAVSAAGSFVIRNNLVTNQGQAGVRVAGATAPSLDHNDVWNNGTDYVGTPAGLDDVSVNPLYVAPVGTLPPEPAGPFRFVASPVNVSNPGNNANIEHSFRHPVAAEMRLRIASVSTEPSYDSLLILDGAGNEVTRYSGSLTDVVTPPVAGPLIRTRFTSDSSVTSAGYSISGFELRRNGAPFNYRLSPSSPVLDIGNGLDAPATDRDGTARPYDGDVNGTATVDIGAYEWHDNIPPVAVAGPDRTILPGTALSFSAAASQDPDGLVESYAWDFGDGTPGASERDVTHTFTALGTFTVTLTVTDDQGATATDTATVHVVDNLPPTAVAGPDLTANAGEVVTLDGGASGDEDGTVVGYSWDFGDGSPAGSGETVTHAWSADGVYTVTLTVTDNDGATATDTLTVTVGQGGNRPPIADAGGPYSGTIGEAVHFDASGSLDVDGSIASYAWDFGDGTSGTEGAVDHVFDAAGMFLVTVTVTDDDGATDEDSVLVTIVDPSSDNVAPTADAGGPYGALVGEAVLFDGSASSDTDGSIVSYAWDFGDGSTGEGETASHSYTAAGSFAARLTVTDNGGAVAQDVVVVVVSATGNVPPVADAGANQTVTLGAAVLLDASGSTDADGNIASYLWDLGDGETSSEEALTHTYAEVGSYLVHLTVTDDDGASDDAYVLVEVLADPETPPADGGDENGDGGNGKGDGGNGNGDDGGPAGCGCQATGAGTEPALLGGAWVLLGALRRRRRAKRGS